MLKKGMAGEVPQSLLDELINSSGLRAEVVSIDPEKRNESLTRKATRLILACGEGDDGQPKKTGTLFTNVGEERVALQLLENPHGCRLSVEVLPHKMGGKRGELNIDINEVSSKWDERDISPEQLVTALGLVLYLDGYGLPPALTPDQRWRIKEKMKHPIGRQMYWWNKKRFGP